MWRAIAAGISVVVAGASGVVTGLVTAHPSRGLWVALGVLVVVGGVIQAVITVAPRRSPAAALGSGAVAVGGDVKAEIRTRVQGMTGSFQDVPDKGGVVASGPGAVGVGGDVSSPVSTDVTGTGGQTTP
jgi:hypothetical protein